MLLENSRSEASPDAERRLGTRSHVGVLAQDSLSEEGQAVLQPRLRESASELKLHERT